VRTRDEWVETAKMKLDEWNAELDRLEEKARSARREQEARYQRKMAELERKRAEVREKLAEIQEAGDAAWDELKDGARKSLEVLTEAVRVALEEFRKGEDEPEPSALEEGAPGTSPGPGPVPPARRPPAPGESGGAALRRTRARRVEPPLGLRARGGRKAGLVGGAQRAVHGSVREALGAPDRGSSPRIRRLRGDHPEGRAGRRVGDRLGRGPIPHSGTGRRRRPLRDPGPSGGPQWPPR